MESFQILTHNLLSERYFTVNSDQHWVGRVGVKSSEMISHHTIHFITTLIILLSSALFNSDSTPLLTVSGQLYVDTYTQLWNTPTACTLPLSIERTKNPNILMAACSRSGGLFQYDFRNGTSSNIDVSHLCSEPARLYRDDLTGLVYVSCNDGGVLSIDGDVIETVVTRQDCPGATSAFKYRDTLYATCPTKGLIALAANGTLTTIVECAAINIVNGDEQLGRIYTACGSNILSIDAQTHAITALTHSERCDSITSIEVDSNQSVWYVGCKAAGLLRVNRTQTVARITSQRDCDGVTNMRFDARLRVLYVTSAKDRQQHKVELQPSHITCPLTLFFIDLDRCLIIICYQLWCRYAIYYR